MEERQSSIWATGLKLFSCAERARDLRTSPMMQRKRWNSVLFALVFLSACVPPAENKAPEAPKPGPDVGTVDNTLGFKVNACRSVKDTTCLAGNYFIHKKGSKNTACEVASTASGWSNVAIDCVAEGPELDLEFFGIALNYNVPSSMCEYVELRPYHYWERKPGIGPTRITVRRDSEDRVIRALVNSREGLSSANISGTLGNPLTFTGISGSDLVIGTPVRFYRGDSRSLVGAASTRMGNSVTGLTTTVSPSTPVTETIKVFVTQTQSGGGLQFRARGSVSGEMGPFSVTGASSPYSLVIATGDGTSLVQLQFTGGGSLSSFGLGDNFTIATVGGASASASLVSGLSGLNVGDGALSELTFGLNAHSGDSYKILVTSVVANGGTFSVTKTPGSYGSSASLPSGTIGTAYESSEINFELGDGAEDFVAGDFFVVLVTSDELPGGITEGATYTLTSRTPTTFTVGDGSGTVNVTGVSAQGSFLFGLVPSGSVKTGASVNSVTGAPVCDFDYTLEEGQNCCYGKYALYGEKVTAGVVTKPNGSEVDWGGKASNCLAGPAMATQSKTKQGYPIFSLYEVAGVGMNSIYTISNSNPIDGKTVKQANYTVANLADATETGWPVGISSYTVDSGYKYKPTVFYEFRCLNRAEEVLARIRVQVREWNDRAQLSAYQACTTSDTSPSNCDVQYPDSDPSLGPDTTGLETGSGCAINDAYDWDDITSLFPAESGGAPVCALTVNRAVLKSR